MEHESCPAPRAGSDHMVVLPARDAHHLGMPRKPDKFRHAHIEFLMRVVRMSTNRAENITVLLGDAEQLFESLDPCADGNHQANARLLRIG